MFPEKFICFLCFVGLKMLILSSYLNDILLDKKSSYKHKKS